jgi:hypothetical protein
MILLAEDERNQKLYGEPININRKPCQPYDKRRSDEEEIAMNSGWKVFFLFAAVFAAAMGLERTFVPDVVPIAFADVPQPSWMVQTAFLLRSLELMTGSVALIALILMFGVWAEKLRETQARLKAARQTIDPGQPG